MQLLNSYFSLNGNIKPCNKNRSYGTVMIFCYAVNRSCTDVQEGSVRLVSGLSANEGRVEICNDGQWGTICNSGWDYRDTQVVCHQLGFTHLGKIIVLY